MRTLSPLRAARYALIVALACAGCSFTAGDRRAIEGVLAGQQAAWNRGDLDGFLRAYEPSDAFVYTAGGAIHRGFAETRDRYRERYGARGAATMGKLGLEVLEVRALGRDGAVVLGRWRLVDTPEAGAGVFTLVFVRAAGGWRIVHDHSSLDAGAASGG